MKPEPVLGGRIAVVLKLARVVCFTLCLLLGLAAQAQTPRIVADIETSPIGPLTDSTQYVASTSCVIDGVAYFTAYETNNGFELWRSDGTPSGTHPVADLELTPVPLPFSGDYPLRGKVEPGPNGKVFFRRGDVQDTSNSGYRTDVLHSFDPAANTLVQLAPDPDRGIVYLSFAGGATLNDEYFFFSHASGRFQLWATDGTPAGARLVADPPRPPPARTLNSPPARVTLFLALSSMKPPLPVEPAEASSSAPEPKAAS